MLADEMLLGERGVRGSRQQSTIWATAHTHIYNSSNAFYNDNSVQVLLIIAASSEARAHRAPPAPLAADTDDFAW